MKKVCLFFSVVVIALMSCEDDDKIIITNQTKELCDSIDILYTNDVKPLLEEVGCSGVYCHGSGAAGYTMSDYETTMESAQDPKFLRALRHETGVSPMPKGREKLSNEEIQVIECWIESGYRE